MKLVCHVFFGRFKFYRKWIGGTWVKPTRISQIGSGPWLPYKPIAVDFFFQKQLGGLERRVFI